MLFFKINCYFCSGEMAEWSIAVVLKTTVPQGTGGSNPSFSATKINPLLLHCFKGFFLIKILMNTKYP